MRYDKNTIEAFFALVRAGLWSNGQFHVSSFRSQETVDYQEVYRLASEQSVLGLVLAGAEILRLQDSSFNIPEMQLLQWIGEVQFLEQRNKEMNHFIRVLIERLREAGIYTVLVKGQGVAQCFERPLWRSSGDVDLFFDAENYEKAKTFLVPLAASVDREDKRKKHLGMTLDLWIVELHGLMPTQISERINEGVYRVQQDVFENEGVRFWNNEDVDVPLPSPDNDAIFIFTHFLQHFFVGGVGLRQICDWCRLLWTYRDVIDRELLEKRLQEMGLMSEWKKFGTFAVQNLGMPTEAMPFYAPSASLERKNRRFRNVVLGVGNFGHNKDASYRSKYPKRIEKSITFWRRLGEFCKLTMIFPVDAPRFFWTYVRKRTEAVTRQ